MLLQLTVLAAMGCDALVQRHVNLGTIPVAPDLPAKLSLPALPQLGAHSYEAALTCSAGAAKGLFFAPHIACGEKAVFSPAQLLAFLRAFNAKMRDLPNSDESLTAELELKPVHGHESTRYAFNFSVLDQVPAEQLSATLDAATGIPLKALRIGSAWPDYQKLEVAVEGDLSRAARGFVKDGIVFVVLEKVPRSDQSRELRVTLRHGPSGLASKPFVFALRATSLQWLRAYVVAAGLAGCLGLLAALVVLALPLRPSQPVEEEPDAPQKAIEQWNRSFIAASFSSIKTEDDSFSTVGSQFTDAHVSMRSNFGLFFSPTVELIELPGEFRLTV